MNEQNFLPTVDKYPISEGKCNSKVAYVLFAMPSLSAKEYYQKHTHAYKYTHTHTHTQTHTHEHTILL